MKMECPKCGSKKLVPYCRDCGLIFTIRWDRVKVQSIATAGLTKEELEKVTPALIRAIPAMYGALKEVENEDRMTEKLRTVVLKALAQADRKGKSG